MRWTAFLMLMVAALAAIGARPRTVAQTPTFNGEVVRILQQRCQECHRPGGMAPFALTTYQEVRPRASQIAAVTAMGRMPLWKPAAGCGEFAGERRLSAAEIRTLAAWAGAGAPEGSPADLPAPVTFGSETWSLGLPDIVTSLPETYQAPPHADTFRCFVLPVSTEEGFSISAVDFRPIARENVHHLIAYVDGTGASLQYDEADPGPGYECMGGPKFVPTALLGGWFPGSEPFVLPPGIAAQVSPGSRLVLQVHYHAHEGMPAPDRTEMAVYLAREPVVKPLRFGAAENRDFLIPAGAADYRLSATRPFAEPVTIHAIGAHMHRLGRRMSVTAALPDGSTRCLLTINDWDPAWQGMYVFKTPVQLPAGAVMIAESSYDNSASNPRNPNQPPRDVPWGEEAFHEMLSAYFAYTVD